MLTLSGHIIISFREIHDILLLLFQSKTLITTNIIDTK